jgi:hypothetical protein
MHCPILSMVQWNAQFQTSLVYWTKQDLHLIKPLFSLVDFHDGWKMLLNQTIDLKASNNTNWVLVFTKMPSYKVLSIAKILEQ